MEKAILKTLIYADIFEYPLKAYEIHKWLIYKIGDLRQVEKGLQKLIKNSKVKNKRGYYFIANRENLINKRLKRKKQSSKYFAKAQIISKSLKIIPWIKLIGISGGLAMENAEKTDDIDLFVITERNRLWLSRLLALGLLSVLSFRRKASDGKKNASGKVCLNLLLDEDHLKQQKEDLYTAHEVLQMKVLWRRDRVYSKYLLDNEWAFAFLPNWVSGQDLRFKKYDLRIHKSLIVNHKSIVDWLEKLTKWFQLKIMQKPKGMERIEDGALYFHPVDYGDFVRKTLRLALDKHGVVG